ncbi:S-adenosyl-L-methionine-dependent methyltransferase [Aspergillus varians]
MASSTPAPTPGTTAAAAFDKASDVYERMTGGCTREVAQFLLTLEPRVDESSLILDNACGTGIITSEIYGQLPDAKPKIAAADLAPSMVANFRSKATSQGWLTEGNDSLTVSIMDAENLTYPDNMFTHSYTNLGFPFFPDGDKAAGHVYRTLKAGGTAFISTWLSLGYLRPVQKAQLAVRSNSTLWEPPMPKEWSTKEKLVAVLEAGGFRRDKIQVQTKAVRYRGEDLQDLLDIMKTSFLGYVTKGWSDTEKEQWVRELANSLSDKEKAAASVEMVSWVAVAQK